MTLAFAAAMLAAACGPRGPLEHRLSGDALGTTWSLVLVDTGRDTTPATLDALITQAIDEVDRAASTWRDDSEVGRFAQLAVGESFQPSEHLAFVLEDARWAHEVSGGAFDPTVAPLVALYGFGAGAAKTPPTEAERAAAAARVDFDAVDLTTTGSGAAALSRTRTDVTLDLSAVAKGYAVDVVATRLRAAGEDRFLFELGGELFLSGTRITGTPWVVAIDAPTTAPPSGAPGSIGRPLYAALAVSDRGLATSGDYRQYSTDENGQRVTHTIDPRSGRSVANEVASVTVLAATCARADALATAVQVLGAEAGLALLESLPDVEGLLLLHGSPTDPNAGAESITERATTGLAPFRLPAPR